MSHATARRIRRLAEKQGAPRKRPVRKVDCQSWFTKKRTLARRDD